MQHNLIWHKRNRFESKHFQDKQNSNPTEFIKITINPNTYHKGVFGWIGVVFGEFSNEKGYRVVYHFKGFSVPNSSIGRNFLKLLWFLSTGWA